MSRMIMAPVPLRPRRITNPDDEFGPNPKENTANLRWCTFGFLMACQWLKNPGMEPPTDEYIKALASLYGLPIPDMTKEIPRDGFIYTSERESL